jgi:hypothetical protein
MRRVLRLIAVFGLLLAALTIGQTSAVATPARVPALESDTCPHPAPYPPSPGATVMASTTTPFVGQTIEVSGKGYCPDEDVEIFIGGTHVATTHTDAAGSFDPSAKVPGPVGRATLLGRGASGLSADSDTLVLTVRSGSGSGSNSGSPSGGPGLALTGSEIVGLIVLAVLLLGGGAVMTFAGRRKRSLQS